MEDTEVPTDLADFLQREVTYTGTIDGFEVTVTRHAHRWRVSLEVPNAFDDRDDLEGAFAHIDDVFSALRQISQGTMPAGFTPPIHESASPSP